MTDLRMRSLSRLSASGDLHAQARLLVERLRAAESCVFCSGKGRRITGYETLGYEEAIGSCPECCGFGSVLRARVALAAYASHEPAALALEETGDDGWRAQLIRRNFSLEGWLKGLSRWSAKPFLAPVRAALAAGWWVVDEHEGAHCPASCEAIEKALTAGGYWTIDPSQANRRTWEVALMATRTGPGSDPPRWLSSPFVEPRVQALFVSEAAALAGEPAIRTAIQKALISWSLS